MAIDLSTIDFSKSTIRLYSTPQPDEVETSAQVLHDAARWGPAVKFWGLWLGDDMVLSGHGEPPFQLP